MVIKMRKITSLLIAVVMILTMLPAAFMGGGETAQAANHAFVPQDIIVNVGSDTSSLNFNWYCDGKVSGTPSVKISGISKTFTGTQGSANGGMKYNKVAVTGLQPDTAYQCRVSSDMTSYSDPYTVKTTRAGDFTFAAVGDQQLSAASHPARDAAAWAATVGEAVSKGAAFIAGTGDQIDTTGQSAAAAAAQEKEYASLTAGLAQDGTLLIPYAAVKGNHEAAAGRGFFGFHYNLPALSDQTVNGIDLIDYYYIQNDVLFVVLDTTPSPGGMASANPYIEAFDRALAAATAACAGQYDWLIVQTHKSKQSNAAHYNDSDINAYSRAGFEDLMTKYKVDIVFAGHDHSYVRTYPFKSSGGPLAMNGITIDKNNRGDNLISPDGTVYMVLNSSSGSKYYQPRKTPKSTSKIEYQGDKPEYTMVDVTPGKLTITTFEAGSQTPVDNFTITKTAPDPGNPPAPKSSAAR